MPKWLKTILYIGLIAWLLRFPPTRMIIIWILPLGSGWDDLVVIVLVIVALVLSAIKGTFFRPKWSTIKRKIKQFFK